MKKEDKLEHFIRQHRSEIDLDEPPEFLWHGIRKGMRQSQKNSDRLLVWQTAAVILLFVSAVLTYNLYNNSKPDPDPRVIALNQFAKEYRDDQRQYQEVISNLQTQVDFENIDKKEFPWIFEELEYLEKTNRQFKEDLNRVGHNEKLIHILLDYYEKKIKILRRLDNEIKRKEYEKNKRSGLSA
jgi:hypothetical protein